MPIASAQDIQKAKEKEISVEQATKERYATYVPTPSKPTPTPTKVTTPSTPPTTTITPSVYYSSVPGWKPENPNAIVVYIDKSGKTTGQTNIGTGIVPTGLDVKAKGIVEGQSIGNIGSYLARELGKPITVSQPSPTPGRFEAVKTTLQVYEPLLKGALTIPGAITYQTAYRATPTAREVVTGFVDIEKQQSIPIQNLSPIQRKQLETEGWVFKGKGESVFEPLPSISTEEYKRLPVKKEVIPTLQKATMYEYKGEKLEFVKPINWLSYEERNKAMEQMWIEGRKNLIDFQKNIPEVYFGIPVGETLPFKAVKAVGGVAVEMIPKTPTEAVVLGAELAMGYGAASALEISFTKTAAIIFNEPISKMVSTGVGAVIPVQDTGFAPDGALPQIGRGALYSVAMLIPGVSTAFITNIVKNVVIDPVRTIESIKDYVVKNPYEIASIYGFSRGVGRIEERLAREKMYYDITDRLINQYGIKSAEVLNFQKAWEVAFKEMPKRIDTIKPWTSEQLKAIAKEPRAQEIVNDVVKKYNPTLIGSTTLLPYLTLNTLRRGLQGDIDVQTVQRLINVQSKEMAQELYTKLKQAGYDVRYSESTFEGYPKYHVTFKGQELLNAGTSFDYFLRTQLGPLRGLFESKVFGQTVVEEVSGARLGTLRGQLRIKLVRGYGGDISRIRELERLAKEGKLEGREKDILDTMDIIEGTKNLFEGEKYIGRIAPYDLKTLIYDIREATRQSTIGNYVVVRELLFSNITKLRMIIERINSMIKLREVGRELRPEKTFIEEAKELVGGEKLQAISNKKFMSEVRNLVRGEKVKVIGPRVVSDKKFVSEVENLMKGREIYPTPKVRIPREIVPKYEKVMYEKIARYPELYPTGYRPTGVPSYQKAIPSIKYPTISPEKYPSIPTKMTYPPAPKISYPAIPTGKYPTIPPSVYPPTTPTKYFIPRGAPTKYLPEEKPIVLPFEIRIPKTVEKQLGPGYNVFGKVIRTNKFAKINTYPLIRERALDIGSWYVQQTLARTYRIEKANLPAQPDYQFLEVPTGFFQSTRGRLREYKIRQRKGIPTPEQYIQKTMFALSSEAEKKSIQEFRRQASQILR